MSIFHKILKNEEMIFCCLKFNLGNFFFNKIKCRVIIQSMKSNESTFTTIHVILYQFHVYNASFASKIMEGNFQF